jgi:phospholipid/cholesterol/gamma-HCH transport system substrate-binding protein
MSPRRTSTALLAAGLAVSALSGCGFRGAASIPLPGGQGNGEDAYKLTIEFEDVLDLVPQSAVKVADVTVGSVESLDVDGYTARVVVRVNGDVELPANSTASVRQTSLLGEKFVSLDPPPDDQGRGQLRGGETIGLDRTERSAEIEEVLGALSLVLNGGSLEQIQTINRELVAALEGREDRVKSVLTELNTFVGGLDAQKQQIVRALDSMDRLTARLVNERQVIATALEDIPAGTEVLTEQREELVRVLTSLDRLGDVAVRVINESKANTVADLRALQPILTQLANAGKAFPESLELLLSYPFPRTSTEGIVGDYANLFVTADIDLRQLAAAEGVPLPGNSPSPVPGLPGVKAPLKPAPQPPAGPAPRTGASPSPSASPSSLLPKLPPVPGGSGDGGGLPLLDRDSLGLLNLLIGGLR